MSSRRPTLAEQRYPQTPEFQSAATAIISSALEGISKAVWAGYDILKAEVFDQIEQLEPGDEGERSVTQLLAPRISRSLSGFEPFYCMPGVKEMESRVDAPAQAPEYDIAFVLRENERICWPLEAKILATDATLAPYLSDIASQFLTCRYAPFSAGGGMIAYLMAGEPDTFLTNVAARLGLPLAQAATSVARPHRTSMHSRTVPTGKNYPAQFTCHHFVMSFARPVVAAP